MTETGAPLRPLPFYYDLYTFRGDAGATTVIASFAVPVEELRKEDMDGDARYRFDVSLVLADTALRSVARTDDSVFVRVAHPLADEHLLHTHIETQAAPSTTTLQRVIMTDASRAGVGQLYTTPFPIPDYSGSRMMLSDIALGLPDAKGGWTRGDVTLSLLPTSRFPEGSFELYYEVYNLPEGTPYTTQIAIERVDDSGREREGQPVRARFSGEAATGPDGALGELRKVEVPLGKGWHRLTVTVTDGHTGSTANRTRFFQVSGWGRGVTLVPAIARRAARPAAR